MIDDYANPRSDDRNTSELGKPKLTDAMVYMATTAMLRNDCGCTLKEADRMWREWKESHWKD